MLPNQEIVILTSPIARLTINLTQALPSVSFACEIIVYDPEFNDVFSSLAQLGEYKSASEAFDEAIKWSVGWAQKNNKTIAQINNPCNCELIGADEQQAILGKYNFNLTIEVNV